MRMNCKESLLMKITGLRLILPLVLALCITGGGVAACSPKAGATAENPVQLPAIPDSLAGPEKRAQWLALHFWDNFNLQAISHEKDSAKLEKAFADFASVLRNVTDTLTLSAAAGSLLSNIEDYPQVYSQIETYAHFYLYSDDSPFGVNEEAFIPFMKAFATSPNVNEAQRYRYDFLLSCAMKNRPGSQAADFSFITREGEATSLLEFNNTGDIILIFYDPDCDTCLGVMNKLAADSELLQMASAGDITVLAIYAGTERNLWLRSAYDFPEEWIVGFDNGAIEETESFDFRMSPTIYLLDAEKKVIVKDLPAEELLTLITEAKI